MSYADILEKDMYYLAFPKDPLRNKIVVYTVYVLELLQTVIITTSAFHVFAAGYGNFTFYNGVELAWFSVPIISGLGKRCFFSISSMI